MPGDDLLKRIERRAVVVTIAAVAIAAVVPHGGAWMAAGVAGGAVLALGSYWAIKRGVGGLADAIVVRIARADAPDGDGGGAPLDAAAARPRAVRGVALLIVRYALLTGIAYVMIARLRLPPIGLLCGASVTVLAAAAELIWRRP